MGVSVVSDPTRHAIEDLIRRRPGLPGAGVTANKTRIGEPTGFSFDSSSDAVVTSTTYPGQTINTWTIGVPGLYFVTLRIPIKAAAAATAFDSPLFLVHVPWISSGPGQVTGGGAVHFTNQNVAGTWMIVPESTYYLEVFQVSSGTQTVTIDEKFYEGGTDVGSGYGAKVYGGSITGMHIRLR